MWNIGFCENKTNTSEVRLKFLPSSKGQRLLEEMRREADQCHARKVARLALRCIRLRIAGAGSK